MAETAISSCLEACRAAALSSHSAAGLVTSVRKVAGKDAAKLGEVARLLRSAEALARQATAALTGMTALARAASLAPTSGVAANESPAAAASSKAARRRRHKKKSLEQEVEPFVDDGPGMDVDTAAVGPNASSSPPLSGAFQPSSEPAAPSKDKGIVSYPAGTSVVLFGLSSRKDLEGSTGTVIVASSAAEERVAVQLASGEKIRVKHSNIKLSIFAAGFT